MTLEERLKELTDEIYELGKEEVDRLTDGEMQRIGYHIEGILKAFGVEDEN